MGKDKNQDGKKDTDKNWIKKIWTWLKEIWPSVVAGLIIFLFVLITIFSLAFWIAPLKVLIVKSNPNNDLHIEFITGLGYLIGVLALIRQIAIFDRRATAAEETAKATAKTATAALNTNIEQRYHNAVDHLTKDNPFIRIGAIYNLYHISQTTTAYAQAIFDVFCEYLKTEAENISKKEKNIIIDMLFRKSENEKIVAKHQRVDLAGASLEDVDLSNINLTGIDLTDAYLTGANLTGATIPHAWDQWEKIASLEGAILDGIAFGKEIKFKMKNLTKASLKNTIMQYMDLSYAKLEKANLTGADLDFANLAGAELTGANLTGASLTGASLAGADLQFAKLTGASLTGANLEAYANFWFADLTGANFTGANLTHANFTNVNFWDADLTDANLTRVNLAHRNASGRASGSPYSMEKCFDQLRQTKCLYDAQNLDAEVEEKLRAEKPELFEPLHNTHDK